MPRLTNCFKTPLRDWFLNNPFINNVIISSKKQNKNSGRDVDLKKSLNTPTSTSHSKRDPPEGYDPKEFKNESFCPPEQIDLKIFRPVEADEVLGPSAHKSATYKNPEYFAYHRYSYTDTFIEGLKFRECGPTVVIECREWANEKKDSDERKTNEKCPKSDLKSKLETDYKNSELPENNTNVEESKNSRSNLTTTTILELTERKIEDNNYSASTQENNQRAKVASEDDNIPSLNLTQGIQVTEETQSAITTGEDNILFPTKKEQSPHKRRGNEDPGSSSNNNNEDSSTK